MHIDRLIDHLKENGGRGSKLIVQDFLEVNIVYSLVFGRFAAEGKPFADIGEHILNTLAQVAVEDGRLSGHIVYILAGLGTQIHDLALVHNQHTLTVRNGNHRAVGNDIFFALGIAAAPRDPFVPFAHQNIGRERVTIEKFFPLVGQHAAGRT